MEITRIGSQPSGKGPEDWFSGAVRIDPLFQPNDSRRAAAASVTFEPGSRTEWHTHPLGQTLIVTGATPTTGMTHIAIQENLDGKVVDWMEKVTDEEYKNKK